MSHYQHFEEENHLQYDKLCGGKQAQNDPRTKAQGGGGRDGRKDGWTNNQAHGRCWFAHIQSAEEKSFLTWFHVPAIPGGEFPWKGRLGKELERVCIWLT